GTGIPDLHRFCSSNVLLCRNRLSDVVSDLSQNTRTDFNTTPRSSHATAAQDHALLRHATNHRGPKPLILRKDLRGPHSTLGPPAKRNRGARRLHLAAVAMRNTQLLKGENKRLW